MGKYKDINQNDGRPRKKKKRAVPFKTVRLISLLKLQKNIAAPMICILFYRFPFKNGTFEFDTRIGDVKRALFIG